MGGLLEEVNVERGADVRGNSFVETIGCALRSEVLRDHCDPVRTDLSGPSQTEVEGLVCDPLSPDQPIPNLFMVLTSFTYRRRGGPVGIDKIVSDALDMESEKAAGVALFTATTDNAVSLMNADVATVPAGTSTTDSIADALVDFWGRATGVGYEDTYIHLGVGPLLELIGKGQIEDSKIKGLGITVVTSAGYPESAIAITGPVLIRLGTDDTLEAVASTDNTAQAEASRPASIEFDPCIAVRVA